MLTASAIGRVAERRVAEALVRAELAAAEALAGTLARQLEDVERLLRLQSSNFRLDVAPDEVRSAFVLATWRLVPEFGVAVLLDGAGATIAGPVYQTEPGPPNHDVVSEERLRRFVEELPDPLGPGEVVVGRPYVPEPSGGAVVPIVVSGVDGTALGVELGLASLAARASARPEDRELLLLAADGTVLVRAGRTGLLEVDTVRALLGSPSADLRVRAPDGREVLGALARVPGRGWTVALAKPADDLNAANADFRARAFYIGGVAVVFAALSARLFSGSITEPVLRIRDAAVRVGAGDFAPRVDRSEAGELGELAAAFDRMTVSLARSRDEIAEKNAALDAFAQDLQRRVDERTAQLRATQARLVQSGQLAAVAEMSAGLAHELNNPIAGVLGLLQVVRHRLGDRPEAALLDTAEKEALRCRDIVSSLLRFNEAATHRVDTPGVRAPASELGDLLDGAFEIAAAGFAQKAVQVRWTRADGIHVRADAVVLPRALAQLLASLRAVAAPGAELAVSVEAGSGPEAKIRFALDRTATDEDDWRAAGLGFWVARQTFASHGATLEPPEGVRGGARAWRLVIPVARVA